MFWNVDPVVLTSDIDDAGILFDIGYHSGLLSECNSSRWNPQYGVDGFSQCPLFQSVGHATSPSIIRISLFDLQGNTGDGSAPVTNLPQGTSGNSLFEINNLWQLWTPSLLFADGTDSGYMTLQRGSYMLDTSGVLHAKASMFVIELGTAHGKLSFENLPYTCDNYFGDFNYPDVYPAVVLAMSGLSGAVFLQTLQNTNRADIDRHPRRASLL